MASTSETGHYRNIANFNVLIQYYGGFGTSYAPSNPDLQLTFLQARYTLAFNEHDSLNTVRQPYTTAVNTRQTDFKAMKKLATRIFSAFKVTANVSPLLVKDAKSILDRIRGERIKKNVPETEEQISVSQQSFDKLYEHFAQLVALVTAVPNYAPNEPAVQPATITTTRDTLLARNNAVIQATVPLKTTLIERNRLLYAEGSGIIDLALASKEYVKSAFGPTSDAYRLIRGVKFRRPKKKTT